MGSDELAANLFRISQTNQKIKNDNITGEDNSCLVHYNMGKDIRKFIKEQGGDMPEDLPTPKYNINDLENKIDKIKKTC